MNDAVPDHKAFLSAVPAAERQALTALSDRAGLTHLALHLGAIVLTGGLIAARVPFWPLLLPLQGVLIVFLFTLEHECTHKTPFATGWLNTVVGHACGLVLVLPFDWFRAFHLAHHRFTNIAGLDPELDAARPQTRRAWAWHVSGLPIWAAAGRQLVLLARGQARAAYLPRGTTPAMRRTAQAMLAAYALAAVSLLVSPVLLWVWVVPMLLGQPALRLYLLAEHGDCPQVANMFLNTRTTFTTALMRFLAWNMPYHVEHHVWPQVPFHRLPALHRRMKAHLQVTSPGYVAFSRAYLSRLPARKG